MEQHGDGLVRDAAALQALAAGRRRALRWLLAGAAAVPLAGCERALGTARPAAASCPAIPDEIAGPFPADGSNAGPRGPLNALALAGIVRADIRAGVARNTLQAQGVPLTLSLQVVDVADGCKPMAGAAVYVWHCDREGRYSLYAPGLETQSYLRGLQQADDNGIVTFNTVFPGCYPGRMPHVHLEVFASLAQALAGKGRLKTSQFAFPMSAVNEAYKDPGYQGSARHIAGQSLEHDMVFRDGRSGSQIVTIDGTLAQGFSASLTLGVAA
ncbi:MAG TPA: intradiol ring-cleavage dioxygenase [Telluria sp.]